MKVSEIYGHTDGIIYAYRNSEKIIDRYRNTDLTFFQLYPIGAFFIFRGKRKYFMFVVNRFAEGGWSKKTIRVYPHYERFKSLIDLCKDEGFNKWIETDRIRLENKRLLDAI